MLKGRDCYDPYEKDLFSSKGGEVSTHNRFSPIADYFDMKEALHDDEKIPDLHPVQEKKITRRVYFKEYEDFAMKDDSVNLCFKNYLNNDYNSFMYINKSNFCSGYFPDFILLPHVDSQLDPIDAFKNCKNSEYKKDNNKLYPSYYPNFCNGKYSKQLSNANSKYNNYYFHEMQPIYKICKKFWKPPKHSPCYERVAKGSGIGTQGDHKYSYKYKHSYQYNNFKSKYNNNNSSNNNYNNHKYKIYNNNNNNNSNSENNKTNNNNIGNINNNKNNKINNHISPRLQQI